MSQRSSKRTAAGERPTTGRVRAPFSLAHSITRPKGGKLRIIIYCRISSDEQRQQSLFDQQAYCRAFLAVYGLVEPDVEIIVIVDDGISGEIFTRPGIGRAGELLWSHGAHLLVSEDSGRLFRNEQAAFNFVGRAVDLGARVICINDRVDTAQDDWPDRLHDAQREHGQANHYLRWRIRRTHEGLWQMGAMLGMLKPGYRYLVAQDASEADDEDEPKFAEIDPAWTDTLCELFDRFATGESSDACARFLTASGLPRYVNAFTSVWTPQAAIAVIRNPIYRGLEQHRVTHSVKQHTTGRMVQRSSKADEVWQRPMPHLRIVTDHVWYLANRRIDDRTTTANHSCGPDNPLYMVPRDSRHPLATLFVCDRCGRPMYSEGSCGFRCSGTAPNIPDETRCWNRATAKCPATYAAIAFALRRYVTGIRESLDSDLHIIAELLRSRVGIDARIQQLRNDVETTASARARWNRIVDADESDEPPESILQKIRSLDEALDYKNAELADLQQSRTDMTLPTAPQLSELLLSIADRLEAGDRLVRDELKLIVPCIRAVPHQQFNGNLVVLRARFEVSLIGLLPASVRLALQRFGDGLSQQLPECFRPVTLEAELFDRSASPKHGVAACALASEGLGPTAIGKLLGITKRCACLAIDYGKALKAAGRTDPYIELTEPPPSASRWRPEGRKPRESA